VQFTMLPVGPLYSDSLVVFLFDQFACLSILHSRVHEAFVRFFSSTLEDRIRYTASDCFDTFPFCNGYIEDKTLELAGRMYHDHRASLMIARNEGLTKTYNRFHDPDEQAPDIQRLRDLHHEMDRTVLRAYGWDDLAATAEAEFLTEDTEQDHRYQGRLFWPASFRDEVLARLLALNAGRAAEERAAGLAPISLDTEDTDTEVAA